MSRVWPLQRRRPLLFLRAAPRPDVLSNDLTQGEVGSERLTTRGLSQNTIHRYERREQCSVAVQTLGLALSRSKGEILKMVSEN